MKVLLLSGAALFACLTASIQANVILVSDLIWNGGFEDGVSSPWGGVTAVSDPAFAHSGNWYGQVSGTRADVFLFLPILNADGHEFVLSFWARIPEVDGFGSLSVALSDKGFVSSATVVPLAQPALSSDEWRFFSFALSTQEIWDDSGNSRIAIGFPHSPGVRYAYIDDIQFWQIPEPSSMTMLIATLVMAFAKMNSMKMPSLRV